MPSKKSKKKKIFCQLYVGQFNGCCGIGIIRDFHWFEIVRKREKTAWSGRGHTYSVSRAVHNITIKRIKSNINKQMKNGLLNYGLLYAAIPDNTPTYRKVFKALTDLGWKLENTTKSNHGDYNINVLSIARPNRDEV